MAKIKDLKLSTDLDSMYVTPLCMENYLGSYLAEFKGNNNLKLDILADKVAELAKKFGADLSFVDPGSGPFQVNGGKKYESLAEAINVVNDSDLTSNTIDVVEDVDLDITEASNTFLKAASEGYLIPKIKKSVTIDLQNHSINSTKSFGANNKLFYVENSNVDTFKIKNGKINYTTDKQENKFGLVYSAAKNTVIDSISSTGNGYDFIEVANNKSVVINNSDITNYDNNCVNALNTALSIQKSIILNKNETRNDKCAILINGTKTLLEGATVDSFNGEQTIKIGENGGTCSCDFWTDAPDKINSYTQHNYAATHITYTLDENNSNEKCGACITFNTAYDENDTSKLSASEFCVLPNVNEDSNFYMTQTLPAGRSYSEDTDLPMIGYDTSNAKSFNKIRIEQNNGFYNRYRIKDIASKESLYLEKDFANVTGGRYDIDIDKEYGILNEDGYYCDTNGTDSIYKYAVTKYVTREIKTVQDLINLKEDVGKAQKGVYYYCKQMNDIDMKGVAWDGIGVACKTNTNYNSFYGTYNGQGYSINNLAFKRTEKMGFFGSIYENSVVKNLTINLDPETDGFRGDTVIPNDTKEYVFGAGVVVYTLLKGAKIENVTTTGTLGSDSESQTVSGGNIGRLTHNGAGIATVAIPSSKTDIKKTSIINCTNKVNIWGSYTKAAGILGYTSAEGYDSSVYNGFVLIQNCRNDGNINNSNSINPDSQGGTGGILGWNGNAGTNCEIDGCENTGLVTRAKHNNINVYNGFGQICGYRNSYIQIYKRLPAYTRSDIQTLPVFMSYDSGTNNSGYEYPNAPVVHMPIHLVMEDGRISLTEDINDAENQDGTKTFKIMAPHNTGHSQALKEPHTITLHNPGAKVNIDYSLFSDMREYINVVCDNTETSCEIITTENNNVVTYEAKAV